MAAIKRRKNGASTSTSSRSNTRSAAEESPDPEILSTSRPRRGKRKQKPSEPPPPLPPQEPKSPAPDPISTKRPRRGKREQDPPPKSPAPAPKRRGRPMTEPSSAPPEDPPAPEIISISPSSPKRRGKRKQEASPELKESPENPQPEERRVRPRRAAACKPKPSPEEEEPPESELVVVKHEKMAGDEVTALLYTRGSREEYPPKRRLVDFIVYDGAGLKPIEMFDDIDAGLFVSALVLPFDKSEDDKEKMFRCEGIGPIRTWSVSGYGDPDVETPVIWITTDYADYECVKPAARYKNWFAPLRDRGLVCVKTYKVLEGGKNRDISVDELVTGLARELAGSRGGGLSVPFTREYLYSIGSYVKKDLGSLDDNDDDEENMERFFFLDHPVLIALDAASVAHSPAASAVVPRNPGSIRIEEPGVAGSSVGQQPESEQSDWRYAAHLQEQENRRAMIRSGGGGRRNGGLVPGEYMKINEDELAADYPLPRFFRPERNEMDEYAMMPDEPIPPDQLPHRVLSDWALYNVDLRFISLELLPMIPNAKNEVDVFGSGLVSDDVGEFRMGGNPVAPAGTGTSGDGGATPAKPDESKLAVFLSPIKEWKIEFGAEFLGVSIRTDGAWYRLGEPSPRYAGFYRPVEKTGKIARSIVAILGAEERASRLSFDDVVKRLAGEAGGVLAGCSLAEVQRYLLVHGPIILQLFAEFPDKRITRSGFLSGLREKILERHHTKLKVARRIIARRKNNSNPRQGIQPDMKKAKPMRATTTRLITQIWGDYYTQQDDAGEKQAEKSPEEQPEEDEESDEEDEDDVEEMENNAPSILSSLRSNDGENNNYTGKKPTRTKCPAGASAVWVGKSIGRDNRDRMLYSRARLRGDVLEPGLTLAFDDDGAEAFLLVEYLYEASAGKRMAHGRVLLRGDETVLGNAAAARELFVSPRCVELALEDARGVVKVEMRKPLWGHLQRRANSSWIEAEKARALEREKEGLPVEYFCQSLYDAEKGGFFSLALKKLSLGSGVCSACEAREEVEKRLEICWLAPEKSGVRYEGAEYRVNDFLYAEGATLEGSLDDDVKKFKGGRNKGLRAYTVCQILEMKFSQKASAQTQLKVRRFYRPEDVDFDTAYRADVHEVYYSDKTTTITLAIVRGKCNVVKHHDYLTVQESGNSKNVFFCRSKFDFEKRKATPMPPTVRLGTLTSVCNEKGDSSSLAKAKGKGKAVEEEQQAPKRDIKLATLDIFAGCGGLSEGLRQAGITTTKWAIEYDSAAAEAFKANHPDAEMFVENCNVVLKCIMENGGDLDDCLFPPEATELASKMPSDEKKKLPKPGEVEFISGGPPCQGFSGMNRFSQRTWSKVQCEMILSFLSYADYFRPRYFLLENVRNFVSFNKGQTFRLTLASLLRMGYQVRFGCLQAGNYGVSQSRTRAFIWAAAPDELLPEWPEPEYVFASSQLKVPLSPDSSYVAVKDTSKGAPLRSITVRDTIGDLNKVPNGAAKENSTYDYASESWFQKNIRGESTSLLDHICKGMNELNLIRCRRIPKRPGADWRDLPKETVKLSNGTMADLIPWCLPNTAERHNQWKGLFGRLDWQGNFPTSITDPQPMGKVGMCFHPEQDRIVTVRECARSQGFPDCYKFHGNVGNKHRQIGNAVPPPLAKALGSKLKEAIEANESK